MMHARLFVVVSLFASALAFPAAAQNYPAKALRLIVPFTPAGSVDIASRAIAK